jgi:hypothetical protein
VENTLVAVGYDNDPNTKVSFREIKNAAIYELSDDNIQQIDNRTLPDVAAYPVPDGGGCAGRNDEYVNAIADVLHDCEYLLLKEVGAYPSRVLLRRGIQTLEQEGDIESLLIKIQQYLKARR